MIDEIPADAEGYFEVQTERSTHLLHHFTDGRIEWCRVPAADDPHQGWAEAPWSLVSIEWLDGSNRVETCRIDVRMRITHYTGRVGTSTKITSIRRLGKGAVALARAAYDERLDNSNTGIPPREYLLRIHSAEDAMRLASDPLYREEARRALDEMAWSASRRFEEFMQQEVGGLQVQSASVEPEATEPWDYLGDLLPGEIADPWEDGDG